MRHIQRIPLIRIEHKSLASYLRCILEILVSKLERRDGPIVDYPEFDIWCIAASDYDAIRAAIADCLNKLPSNSTAVEFHIGFYVITRNAERPFWWVWHIPCYIYNNPQQTYPIDITNPVGALLIHIGDQLPPEWFIAAGINYSVWAGNQTDSTDESPIWSDWYKKLPVWRGL